MRQVRGPSGAAVCETRHLGIKWPHWHTLLFEGQVALDMRVVCPQDVKKMLLKQARSVAGTNASYAAKKDQRSVDR